jgi:hypothetical protein
VKKSICSLSLITVALLLVATPLMAQDIKLSGAHYNLNIIGVEKGKKADMQNSERHTIFVGLGSAPKNAGQTDSGTVETRIYLAPSQDGSFKVCDGNGFDAAIDCEGNQKSTNGAVFQLPCNTNIPDDQDFFVPCDESIAAATSYSVYARALAKPGGQAIMTTCATDEETGETVCSTESTLLVRASGKSSWQNETNALTSIVTFCTDDLNFGVVNCDAGDSIRISLFAGDLEEWFWKYQNNGLRLAQLRFYLND